MLKLHDAILFDGSFRGDWLLMSFCSIGRRFKESSMSASVDFDSTEGSLFEIIIPPAPTEIINFDIYYIH